ncbi:MAG: SDR family oxidoreductase [Ruminococcus sp.]|nr:SDR family oxidoreductase [Ruminococcus sp.]
MANRRKKVLLTGGTQGIGETTLQLLVEKGYEVHITYRSSAKKAEEFCQKYPGIVYAYKLDQGDPKAIKKADFLNEHSWDGIIFNAALGSATAKVYQAGSDELAFETDDAMMRVNALGPLWIYKKVKDNLLKRTEKTKLIFISSVGGGIAAFPFFTLSDGMSKCAVSFLGKQLAAEHTHTLVDVFVVCPGATETQMFKASTLNQMSPEEREAFDLAQAKKRLIQPEEISYWLEQLLRDESTVLHGASIDATLGLGSRPGIQTEYGLKH